MKYLFITYCFLTSLIFTSGSHIPTSEITKNRVFENTLVSLFISAEIETPAIHKKLISAIDFNLLNISGNKTIPTTGFYEEPKTLDENYRRAQTLLSTSLKI